MSAVSPEPPGLHAAMRTLRIDAATAEVVNVLREGGVPSILLKGPSVARWIYDGASRPYGDCDLLVRRSDLEASERSLRTLGFERGGLYSIPGDWPRHAAVYRRGDVVVDLHQTLLGVTADADRLWEVLAPHREQMRIAGASVDVLDPAGRAFVLALHSAKDGGRDEKPRRDLERALEILPPDLWRAAAEIAAAVGSGEAFAAGLRRCPAGRELSVELDLSPRVSREIALRQHDPAALSVGMDWLLRSKGTRRKVALVARKIVPPPAFLREWSPLARRGRWGLALAYLWRPLWLLWRAPAAVRAVVVANSKARGSRSVGPAQVASRLPLWSKIGLWARIWWTFATVTGVERRHPLPQAVAELGVGRTEGPPPAGASPAGEDRRSGLADRLVEASMPVHGTRALSAPARAGRSGGVRHRDAARSSIEGRARMGGGRPGRCGSSPGREGTSPSGPISPLTPSPRVVSACPHMHST